jgi:hypothetical protein
MSDGIRGLCEKSDEYQSYISGDQKNDYDEIPAPEDEDLEDSIPF